MKEKKRNALDPAVVFPVIDHYNIGNISTILEVLRSSPMDFCCQSILMDYNI